MELETKVKVISEFIDEVNVNLIDYNLVICSSKSCEYSIVPIYRLSQCGSSYFIYLSKLDSVINFDLLTKLGNECNISDLTNFVELVLYRDIEFNKLEDINKDITFGIYSNDSYKSDLIDKYLDIRCDLMTELRKVKFNISMIDKLIDGVKEL